MGELENKEQSTTEPLDRLNNSQHTVLVLEHTVSFANGLDGQLDKSE